MSEFKPFIVFVYGTLQHGFNNHRVLGNSKFLGDGELTSSYLMYDGVFPYLTEVSDENEDRAGFPIGELYTVTEKNVAEALDILEGNPHHYIRKDDIAEVYSTGEFVDVVVYVASEATTKGLLDKRVPIRPSEEKTLSWPI